MKFLGCALLLWLCRWQVCAQTPTAPRLTFEKVYLHTDRDTYAAGDTIWYKAYLTDAQSGKLAGSSGTLYVELINPDAAIINTQIIKLKNGVGNADLQLTDSLAAGTYRLRAYTSWMRNFGDNFIFEKHLNILGISQVISGSGKPAAAVKSRPAATIQIPAAAVTKPATLNFYPEGGSMLAGISGIVAVKAADGNDKGLPAKGFVTSSSGDTVARFSCDSLGMGLFALLPLKGQTYRAMATVGRSRINTVLPGALNQGLALQIRQSDSVLHMVISNSGTTEGARPQYKITVKRSGATLVSQQFSAISQQTPVRIPTGNLPEGMVEITVYDEQNRPQSERLIYIHHPDFNPGKVSTVKTTYRPYEQATVQVDAGQPANLSVAVVDADTTPEQDDNILAYMMLGSELRGKVEQPRRYFDPKNADRFKQLDQLLLVQGWRDFIWRHLADSALHISYPAEKGISISGLVEDEVTHKPLPNLYISMFNEKAATRTLAAASNAQGKFLFADLNLAGKPVVKLSATNVKGKRYGSFVLDTLNTLPVKKLPVQIATTEDSVASVKLLRRSAEAKRVNGGKVLKEVTIKAKTPVYMSTHDKNHVALDDGSHFLTWGDIQTFTVTKDDYWAKTLTWFCQQKFKNSMGRADGPGIYVVYDARTIIPKLVVNGSTVNIDPALYWNLPIERYKKVDLVPVFASGGSMKHPTRAILFLTTKENATIDNSGTLTATLNGYYEARRFYAPDYAAGPPAKGDYRSTIHWQPDVKTDIAGRAIVNFYNSGTGKVRVIIQGLTDSGAPVSAETVYEVK